MVRMQGYHRPRTKNKDGSVKLDLHLKTEQLFLFARLTSYQEFAYSNISRKHLLQQCLIHDLLQSPRKTFYRLHIS